MNYDAEDQKHHDDKMDFYKKECKDRGIDLKPRHLYKLHRTLDSIWREKFLDREGMTLDNLFAATYAPTVYRCYNKPNVLYDIITSKGS